MSDPIDQQIADLNRVGLSLTTIGNYVGLHHTTVKLRLQNQGLQPADTRRAFMEDIFNSLSVAEQIALIHRLQTVTSIKEYVRELIRSSLV